LQYVLKFDCTSDVKKQGETLRTAIRINEEFTKYGKDGEYMNNMAIYYGNVSTTSGSTMSFAVYKYLGIELGDILFGTHSDAKYLSLDDKKKIILNVISCLMRFNKNLFLHGDIRIENFVYNIRTGEIELIDFDTMQNLTEISESKECTLTAYADADKFEICSTPTPPGKCLTYYYYCRRLSIPEMGVLFGMSTGFGKDIKRPTIIKMDSKNIVRKLMRADKIGLFWVIIKILLSDGIKGLTEDKIDELFGISVKGNMRDKMVSYYKFYETNNSTIGISRELEKNLGTHDNYMFFKDFIITLLQFIQIGSQVGMDTLLDHPFLFLIRLGEKIKLFMEMENKTEEAYNSIYDSADNFLKITKRQSAYDSDRTKVQVMITALNAAYEAYIQSQELISGQGGGNKKYRASSGNRTKKRNKQNRRNRTKKRNKRNKQNRRNRTKKTKSRSRLVRRCK
jgi:hypothetical protein